MKEDAKEEAQRVDGELMEELRNARMAFVGR